MMKKFLTFLICSIICLSVVPSSYAESAADSILSELSIKEFDRTSDEAWQSYIELLFSHDSIDPDKLSFGYYNFQTGEEYYHNADEYFIAASMYKVPINMAFAEMIYKNEFEFDTEIYGVEYSEIQERTIIDSNNELCELLWNYLGGYIAYKKTTAQYMSDDPENMPPKYYENNFFTARQFVHCLKLLNSEQERFPGIVDCMLKAAPTDHFKRDVQWCDIAHKIGYLYEEGYHSVLNDCAIVYANEPFAIVMFTELMVLKKYFISF